MKTAKRENVRYGTHILNGEDIQEPRPDTIGTVAKVRISRQRHGEKIGKGERLRDGEDIQGSQPHL
jgi:hypothetical protein